MTIALAVAVLAAVATPALAQEPPEVRDFTRWIAEGERAEIPWKIHVNPPQLSLDQRLEAVLEVSLDQGKLKRHGQQHDLVFLVRLAQGEDDWLPETIWLTQALSQPLASGTQVIFSVTLLLTPGRHRVGIVLLDRVSGHRSVAVRKINAKPLSHDPLPELWDSLSPRARLWAKDKLVVGSIAAPAGGQPLAIPSIQPLHVEVVVAFTGYSTEWQVEPLLRALEPLATFSVLNGSLRVSALDLVAGNLLLEQDLAAPLDWERLRGAFDQIDPNVVSFAALQNHERILAFFPQFLQQRLRAEACPTPSATTDSAAVAPRCILIVLALGVILDRNLKIPQVQLEEDCNCDAYYLRLGMLGRLRDELGDSMRSLKPQTFDISRPEDYRRALAKILKGLRAF